MASTNDSLKDRIRAIEVRLFGSDYVAAMEAKESETAELEETGYQTRDETQVKSPATKETASHAVRHMFDKKEGDK